MAIFKLTVPETVPKAGFADCCLRSQKHESPRVCGAFLE
jgi:hypothetical protein